MKTVEACSFVDYFKKNTMADEIRWGIIGCGDVTEVKSGPALNKVANSRLVAVMRRDEAKARDYANRHGVPNYYTRAEDLINDPGVNAVYIATPPDSHEEYALASIAAGKPVYVEKPMALNQQSAQKMIASASAKEVKLVVAHYRRAQPYFNKIKDLLDDAVIGQVQYARLEYSRKPVTAGEMGDPKTAWRLDPTQSGGGLFHDLAPHQLGLMLYYFGEVEAAAGFSTNHGKWSAADDMVSGTIQFKNKIHFTGKWCFNVAPADETDYCEIIGSKGSLGFTVFNKQQIVLRREGVEELIDFAPLQHVQQPMIEKVVAYFLDKAENPCPPGEGHEVMKLMDAFTAKKSSSW